jgi:hypothetical protein
LPLCKLRESRNRLMGASLDLSIIKAKVEHEKLSKVNTVFVDSSRNANWKCIPALAWNAPKWGQCSEAEQGRPYSLGKSSPLLLLLYLCLKHVWWSQFLTRGAMNNKNMSGELADSQNSFLETYEWPPDRVGRTQKSHDCQNHIWKILNIQKIFVVEWMAAKCRGWWRQGKHYAYMGNFRSPSVYVQSGVG